MSDAAVLTAPITFERQPDAYAHWNLNIDGHTASLSMNVSPHAPSNSAGIW